MSLNKKLTEVDIEKLVHTDEDKLDNQELNNSEENTEVAGNITNIIQRNLIRNLVKKAKLD